VRGSLGVSSAWLAAAATHAAVITDVDEMWVTPIDTS
jgi:hypothetical protein